MPINYTKVDIRGNAYPDIFTEVLFQNATISDGIVNFVDDIKSSTIFTENNNTVGLQAYTTGAPSVNGTMSLADTEITPVKVMYYTEYEYDSLRPTRFNSTMKSGAFETVSTEFDQKVLKAISPKISAEYENQFWSGIKSTTKSTIASTGTASYSTAELSFASNATTTLFDGVVARMLYNSDKSAVGGRVSVAGTTITSANINAEYAKLYAAIPAVVLNNNEGIAPFIYAPRSHKQLINIHNTNATYRDVFSVNEDRTKYFYNGIEIKFVPLAENTMIAASPINIHWCTDLVNDYNSLVSEKIAANRDDFFLKSVGTIYCHITRQNLNVLYRG